MEEKVNLKDIKNSTLLDILDEYLFSEGIVVYDYYKDKNFLDVCTFGTNYMVMFAVDIDIYFEDSDDPDYPIKMSYETLYTNSVVTLDYISQELYNNKKENK